MSDGDIHNTAFCQSLFSQKILSLLLCMALSSLMCSGQSLVGTLWCHQVLRITQDLAHLNQSLMQADALSITLNYDLFLLKTYVQPISCTKLTLFCFCPDQSIGSECMFSLHEWGLLFSRNCDFSVMFLGKQNKNCSPAAFLLLILMEEGDWSVNYEGVWLFIPQIKLWLADCASI